MFLTNFLPVHGFRLCILSPVFSIIQGSKPPMFDGLQAIIDNNDERCLTHKLCKKYFSVKWREKGCYVYLANLFIFLCFHVLFNVYVALIRGAIAVRLLNAASKSLGLLEYF
jgi:hypothetical protein